MRADAQGVLRVHAQGAAHDLWQAFLFAPAGEWTDVHVPLERFLKTWRGKACGACVWCGCCCALHAECAPPPQVLESENEMNATKIISVGISVAGGGALEVHFVTWAALVFQHMHAEPACLLLRSIQPPGPYRLELERIHACNRAAMGALARRSA
jgi:hypothetical protein